MQSSRPRLSLAERLYLPQVLDGIAITTRHFFRNLILHILHLFGVARTTPAAVTVQYPEERKVYSEGFRGAHRLTLKPDGSVRCTACFLCATACPARCIHIEAGEHPDPEVEKYPVRYEIDTLQCIYCGMCVEACPCDAIRMDTQRHDIAAYSRDGMWLNIKELLNPGSRKLTDPPEKFTQLSLGDFSTLPDAPPPPAPGSGIQPTPTQIR